MVDFTPPLITAIASIALSLLMERVPGFSGWFEKKTSSEKRFVMTVMLMVTAAAVLVWNCTGTQEGLVTCLGIMNWKTAVLTFLATLTNQPAHQLTKKPDEGFEIK